MKSLHRIGLLAAALVLAPAAMAGMGDPTTVSRIVEEGKLRNQAMKHLEHLTKKIGPRMTGSPGLSKAQQWAMSEFKKWGLKNVHLDQWGDVPVGFERGKRQMGRMVSPIKKDFQISTMNWMPGTEGKKKGVAIMAPKTMEEFNAVKSQLKGAWVIMEGRPNMRPAAPTGDELKNAIDAAGIHGRVYGYPDDRVYAHGTWRDKTFENRPKDVIVYVRKEDYDAITNAMKENKKPELEFDIENKWIKGPLPQYNVIADIPGTEKPDEIVIVCGHLDSWNAPGSQGACDNGTGSVTAMEAARILMAAKAKPKRTIRFILWSGEEQGLLGSRAYVDKHPELVGKISAVLNDDGGTNYHGGYIGIESMKKMMEEAFAPSITAFPGLPMRFESRDQMPQGGSSDHAPFIWAGVPAFFTIEAGRADYGKVWHTQYDQYEYAIPEYIVQSSTNHAIVSYNLACADSLLPRAPKPERRTVRLNPTEGAVGADHMYEDPKLHADHDHEDDYILEVRDRFNRMMRFITQTFRGR